MNPDINTFLAYSHEQRAAVLSIMDAEHRAWVAQKESDAASRAKAIRTVRRTRSAREFLAANRRLDRCHAPMTVIRDADATERAIAAGILPNNIAEVTARVGRHSF